MPAVSSTSNFSAKLPPPPKAAPPPTSGRTGNNPRGVAIAQLKATPPPVPVSARTSNNPRGVVIPSRPPAPTVNDRAAILAQALAARTMTNRQTATNSRGVTNRQSASIFGSESPSQRLAFLVQRMTQEAVRDPWSPIAANGLVMTAPLRQLEYQGQFNQDFQSLQSQGLLPKGARQPPLVFPDSAPAGALAYSDGRKIYIPPLALQMGTDIQGNAMFGPGREVPIHELAHTMQHIPGGFSANNKPLVEGGAQAWADAVTPRVVGPVATTDGSYAGYVNRVRADVPWFMRKQFR